MSLHHIWPVKIPSIEGAPHAFPYQGSKRGLAHAIVPLLPADTATLVEPFCGSAAVSIAALHSGAAKAAHIRDLNAPLVDLWRAIIEDAGALADQYEFIWKLGADDPVGTFAKIRDRFNADHSPADLLYLLNRIVKAAIRYNGSGQMNQGADKRRLGAKPALTRTRLTTTGRLLAGRVLVSAGDYADLLHAAEPDDVVYMDPPYQGTSGTRDGRYLGGLAREDFVAELRIAVNAGASFLVSYDGSTGGRTYGEDLPVDLGLLHVHLHAGVSTQATLSGVDEQTIESLYISAALVDRLGGSSAVVGRLMEPSTAPSQAGQVLLR